MSAWVVDKAHIDYLLTAGLAYGDGYLEFDGTRLTRDTASLIGARLWRENIESVRYRYDDAEPGALPGPQPTPAALDYTYAVPRTRLDPVVALKAIHCYAYQSCEHPGWETSAAKQFCDDLTADAIGKLPGYDAAPWGIDE